MKNMRKIVKQGYEKGDYIKDYKRTKKKISSFKKWLFDELFMRIPKKSSVLDFGCGAGVPYDNYLINKGYKVTGIDISEKHINLAKKFVKKGNFFIGDFSRHNFKEKYNAIFSAFAIFHIPRKEHKNLFEKMHSLLKKDGMILISLGAESMKYNIQKFVGSKMAWSSYSIKKNKKLLRKVGFKIIFAVEADRKEHHLWILAKKI